ncbi:MAG TPA: YihY/virulence factor BrkB family protein [Actinomycetota bacterium]|nr:YihY/virulence factor BrkB family protein [Actinomycetota bacterium]
MSPVSTVPETRDRDTSDDARALVRRSGSLRLFREAAARARAADVTMTARALGHSTVTTLIPAVIAVIGFVTVFELGDLRSRLADAATSFAPGPAGGILTDALEGARPSSAVVALVGGLAAMLLSGTLGMAMLERAANRIYGVEEHRPPRRRYGLALLLAATVEVMLMVALAIVVAGGSVGDRGSSGAPASDGIWSIVRWPIGVALVVVAMTVIFRVVPNRRQPEFSWLLSGTAVAVVAWIGATLLLGLFYERVTVLGGSYGPLLGILALLVWAYGTGLAVLFGLSFAAQLEAARADVDAPSTVDGRSASPMVAAKG